MFELKSLSLTGRVFAFALVISLLLSAAAFADPPRERGKDKKADKFINGHDARDGRFDGRGPRRDRVSDRWDDDDRDRWDRRRDRRMDRDDRWDRRRDRWMDRDDRWDRRRDRRMDRDDRWDRNDRWDRRRDGRDRSHRHLRRIYR